jgi:1,4-alpha-glucan branching enzyme
VIAYMRRGETEADDMLIVLNVTPVVRRDWKIQYTGKKKWKEVFNSNDAAYWGTGDVFNPDPIVEILEKKTSRCEITCHLPALGGVVFH